MALLGLYIAFWFKNNAFRECLDYTLNRQLHWMDEYEVLKEQSLVLDRERCHLARQKVTLKDDNICLLEGISKLESLVFEKDDRIHALGHMADRFQNEKEVLRGDNILLDMKVRDYHDISAMNNSKLYIAAKHIHRRQGEIRFMDADLKEARNFADRPCRSNVARLRERFSL